MSFLQKYLQKTPQNKHHSAVIAYLAALDHISEATPEIASAIIGEVHNQRSHLKLVASENYSSLAVQLSLGNLLTDKYAEGYPHHRFYAGCKYVDQVEDIAIKLLKNIFGCDHAYVQPHSGADANMVAFWSILVQKIQDKEVERLGKKNINELSTEEYEKVRQLLINQKIMGLSLASGGHLTHGYRHNVSSKMMQSVSYDVDPETCLLDYKALQEQVKKEKPAILVAGYSSYPRKLNFAKMREIADSVGAVLMTDMAHFAGLVAGKVFVGEYDPVKYSHVVTSTTHKTLRGPRGGLILCTEEFRETMDKGCPLVLGGPLPHVIASKAVAFKEANTLDFQNYAQNIVTNAQSLAEGLMERGINVVTGGTDNHIVLINTASLGITGRQAESALTDSMITANRNTVPNDKNGPWYTSGIRIGTPALTTLGMGTQEMDEVADIIALVLKNTKPTTTSKGTPSKAKYVMQTEASNKVSARVGDLLGRFPLYPELQID
jgi:glycine hydroxymethyltransferase